MKRKFFYARLAITNIKKNSKTYVPYILTCIGTISMFYNMLALTTNNSTGDGSLALILMIGVWVVALFSAIFIFYTNSFLVKRRKKEFGIYNVLGMEKKHIAKVMFWENSIIAFLSLVLGLIVGIVFSKLVTLILHKILKFDPGYGFEVSFLVIAVTLALFPVIFTLTLITSLCHVYKSKPVELLRGSSEGEKEPKSNWFIALIGVLALGGGYGIALCVKNPMATVTLFFGAVLLVIIGTYCLFTAGSVVLLKILRRNKSFYYKTNHFVSLSGMIYRMKKNAVGLANICIISTAVLVMVSTTISLYVGMNDVISKRYPKDAMLTTQYTPETRIDGDTIQNTVKDILAKDNIPYNGFVGYESLNVTTVRDGNTYEARQANTGASMGNISQLIFITDDYLSSFSEEKHELGSDEIILLSDRQAEKVNILGHEFSVKKVLNEFPDDDFGTWLVDIQFVVVNSTETIDEMYYAQKAVYGEDASSIRYDTSFDFDMDDQAVIDYCNNGFTDDISSHQFSYGIRQLNIQQFYILYGGLFFLGIFLGFLFLMATVLIIYYKQVVEGYEDRERFNIMQKVGMSKHEIKKAINSQILTVFALPILAAVIHIAVAFRILTMLLSMLNLTNVPLFALCTVITIIVFAIFYVLVYFATSKVYYKIINQDT